MESKSSAALTTIHLWRFFSSCYLKLLKTLFANSKQNILNSNTDVAAHFVRWSWKEYQEHFQIVFKTQKGYQINNVYLKSNQRSMSFVQCQLRNPGRRRLKCFADEVHVLAGGLFGDELYLLYGVILGEEVHVLAGVIFGDELHVLNGVILGD